MKTGNDGKVKKMNEEEFEDFTVKEWLEEYGVVTGYTWMVYGPMTIKDDAIINKGLTLTLMDEGYGDLRYVQIIEEVDSEKAELYKLKRGWNIQWIFPGILEQRAGIIINKTIEEGLDFLKLSYQFLGTMGGAGSVTHV